MQTILKHCTAVLSRIIFIGFSVQIVLGILWMCNAFAGFAGPGEGIVCVGALLLVGAAVLFMKRSVCEGGGLWSDLFAVLSVVTFPFVMQSLMKPDVRILVTATLLLGMGGVCGMLRKFNKGQRMKALCIVLCFWLVAGGLVVGTDIHRQGWTPHSTRLTERMVWTALYDTYAELPQEVRDSVNYDKLVESTYEATGMRDVLVPVLVEELGEQEAQNVLGEFRATAWESGKKQILKEMIWDVAGYAASPLVVPMQLFGRAYDSYTGMNYRELLQPAPELGKFYTNYSCWWFAVALVCGTLIGVLHIVREKRKPALCQWVVIVLTSLGLVLGFALDGAGRMDYKNTLFVLCIWLIWMAGGVQDEKG